MARAPVAVDGYMAALDHPFKDVIEALRRAVLLRDPERITETVKWNAPNFRFDAEDRATLRLQPGNRMELILHRGAKVRSDDFSFEDPSGLVRWLAPDRALVTFSGPDQGMTQVPAVADLVHAWMRACA